MRCVMSCLNMAEQVDAELANWIKQHVSFPSHYGGIWIVPAMTAESFR